MDGVSSVGQQLGAINIAMLKKTQNLVADQMAELIGSLPQSPNGGGVGGRVDVTG
jgi:hypothetical protein